MFGVKLTSPSSIFYTNLNDSEEDDKKHDLNDGGKQEPGHSFHRIANNGGFSRFQPFVMSASSTDTSMNLDTSKPRESVLEYKNSTSPRRYSTSIYAHSESDSDEDDEESQHLKKNKTKKAERVAEELLASEKKYVKILHLIDQVFQFRVDQENRAHPMFPTETIQQMFSNIKSIYKFHNDFLLPQLEERMSCWETKPKIGDIMKNFAPFLKMYTEYVKNFDYAMNLINTLQTKITRFAGIMNEIQNLEECAKLSLQQHMLCPIQRLPRYELLLKGYIRNLEEDHPDYQDTKKALELVSTAANHTNEAMKKIDKFKKLLEIQESIGDEIDLVSATRELMKEGRIVKISARSGDHQERYMFLFSDLLLLCSIRLIAGPLYRLRAIFPIENLRVIEGDNLETANTFYLRDDNKSVELYTDSTVEKAAWLDALFVTMQEIMRRKASLKTVNVQTPLVKADDVTRCMVCEMIFSVIKRKHNCRACGIVVCNKCSNQKLFSEDKKSMMRVCRLCHAALTQPLIKSPSTSPVTANSPVPSLLQVSAKAPSVLSDYLLLKTQASQPWIRRWFALHTDFVLYSFKSDIDSIAMTATPMPGFVIVEGIDLSEEDPLNTRDRIRAFKIHHSRKSYYLQASSQASKEKWVYNLRLATKAELPSTENNDNDNAQVPLD